MAEIRNCPFLDNQTDLCGAIGLNILKWPSGSRLGTGGGFCLVKDNLTSQISCSRHPDHKKFQLELQQKDPK